MNSNSLNVAGTALAAHTPLILIIVMLHYIGKINGALECDNQEMVQHYCARFGCTLMIYCVIEIIKMAYLFHPTKRTLTSNNTLKFIGATCAFLYIFSIGYRLAYDFEQQYKNNREDLLDIVNNFHIITYAFLAFTVMELEMVSFVFGSILNTIRNDEPGQSLESQLDQLRSRMSPFASS